MNITRSRLLIALVLYGVLGVGVLEASANLVKLSEPPPSSPVSAPIFQPGASPDAGEPDYPNQSPRINGSAREQRGEPTLSPTTSVVRTLAESLRWTWVVWMARYLSRVD
jgi:hypothetical protein